MNSNLQELNLILNQNSSISPFFPSNATHYDYPFETILGPIKYSYHGDVLSQYKDEYKKIHGYLSMVFCVFGITSNILNIIVLTRKNMLSPTNTILIGLAVSDIFVMSSYIPFAYHNYIRKIDEEERYGSYAWTKFILFHQHFTITSHTISTWLTVTVAIWRFLAVRFPQNAKLWCSMKRAKWAVISTYFTCPIVGIPGYFTSTIIEQKGVNGKKVYFIDFNEGSQLYLYLKNITIWSSSVIMKLVPCVVLTGISFGLISVLYERNLRRRRLGADVHGIHDRTTRMLLVVLMLFLITEFPSGLLALLSGILGEEFFENVYLNLGDTMDALALMNNAINFIIYCTMSQQFRNTFANLFLRHFLKLNTPTMGSPSVV